MYENLEMHKLHTQVSAPVRKPAPEENKSTCICDRMEFAEGYTRNQPFGPLYSPEEGLARGTVFPCLSKPYKGFAKRPACV